MSLLDELSPYLRGLLTRHCYGPAISCVPFFHVKLDGLKGQELENATAENNLFVLQVTRASLCPSIFQMQGVVCCVYQAGCQAVLFPGADGCHATSNGIWSPRNHFLFRRPCHINVRPTPIGRVPVFLPPVVWPAA